MLKTPTLREPGALIALFSITLIRLPYLATYTSFRGLVVLLPVILAIIWLLPQRQNRPEPVALLVAAAVLFFGIALFRGHDIYGQTREIGIEVATVASFALLGSLLMTTAPSGSDVLRMRLRAVIMSPAVYVSSNVVLHFAGFAASAAGQVDVSFAAGTPNSTLALIGIHISRFALPMNPSINDFGLIAACGLTGSILLLRGSAGRERTILWCLAGGSLLGLAFSDTRGAIALALVIGIGMLFIQRPRASWLLLVVIPFSFVIVKAALNFAAGSSIAQIAARGANDFTTGNGRLVIWTATLHTIEHAPVTNLLFGWGADGQYPSGASGGYSFLFFGITPQPWIVQSHNLALQTLLDWGLVGLLVLTLTAFVASRRFELALLASEAAEPRAALGCLVLVYLTGSTESSPTYRSQETLLFAFLLLGAATGVKYLNASRDSRVEALHDPAFLVAERTPASVRIPSRRERSIARPAGSD